MGKHSIAQTVFAVEPAKEQSKTAIEQEAPEQNHRGDAHEYGRCRQMSRRKEQRRNHICHDQDARGWQFLLSGEDFLQDKRNQRQHKQPQHHFFDYTAIQHRCDHIGNCGFDGIGIHNDL